MGSKIAFYDSRKVSEEIGILPDLWINGQDALDAVIRICNYYNLNQPES